MVNVKTWKMIVIDKDNVRWCYEKTIDNIDGFVKESKAIPKMMDFSEARDMYEKYEPEEGELVLITE